jgi:hypothetical protein
MRRALVVTLTVLVALTTLSSCGFGGLDRLRPGKQTTASSAPPKPYLATPKVGECHDLTLKHIQAASDTRKPVACSSEHTTQTVAVVKEPPGARKGSEDARAFAVGEACADGFKKVVGGSSKERARTLYSLAWFGPTKAQKAKGAGWMRCDVTLTDQRHAYPISGKQPLLKGGATDDERRCGRLTSGEGLAWEFAPCGSRHHFEPKKFIEAAPGVSFKDAEAGAKKACDDGLYTWAGTELWGVGDRWYTCWGPAKDISKDDDTLEA